MKDFYVAKRQKLSSLKFRVTCNKYSVFYTEVTPLNWIEIKK